MESNNIEHNNLNDISLDNSNNDNTEKRKYFFLIIILFIIFILSVVSINLISNNSSSNLVDSNSLEEIRDNNIKKDDNSNIIDDNPIVSNDENINNSVDNNENNELEEINNILKLSVPTKNIVKPTTVTTKKLSGSFVQVSALSDYPTKEYLNNIKAKGYSYKIYKTIVNGKLFHKILIGPYKNKNHAQKYLSKIRKDFNNPSAYIYK